MTNEEKSRAVWEALGERWFVSYILQDLNPDLTSDDGKVKLLRKMEKQKDGKLFFAKLIYRGNNVQAIDDDGYIPRKLITDQTGKLLNLAYKWLIKTGMIDHND